MPVLNRIQISWAFALLLVLLGAGFSSERVIRPDVTIGGLRLSQPTAVSADLNQFEFEIGAAALFARTPRTFLLLTTRCVSEIRIDGKVTAKAAEGCLNERPHGYQFPLQLAPGEPVKLLALFKEETRAGSIELSIAPGDHLLVLLRASCVLFLVALFAVFSRFRSMSLVLTAAVLLRILYLWHTPPWARGYDFNWHFNYVRWVANHWSIPPAEAGPMFYHPPLYYFLAAPVYRTGTWLGFAYVDLAIVLQSLGVVISLATGVVAMSWLASLERLSYFARQVGIWIIATSPVLVIPSARVNNDTLALFFQTALLAILMHSRRPEARLIKLASAVFTLGVLTKTTTLLLGPPLAFVLWQTLRQPALRAAVFSGILIIAAGLTPYLILRTKHDGALRLEGNLTVIDPRLNLSDGVTGLLYFSPPGIVEQPFNNTRDDATRRGNFLEFYLRSVFFGEFRFEELRVLAQALLISSMIVLVGTLAGIGAKWRDYKLEILTVVAGFGGHLVYRVLYPTTCGQDFRYTAFVFVPALIIALAASDRYRLLLRPGLVIFLIGGAVFSLAIPLCKPIIWGGW